MPTTDAREATPLGRVVAWLSRHLTQALRTVDLNDSQYRLLAFLADGESAASTLAGRLALTRPTITALVDGLESRGLVERHADERDRRRVRVVLTDAGAATLAAADAAVSERLGQVLDHLDHDQRQEAELATRRWAEALLAAREARR